jgi:hypothetical protein
MTTLTTQAERDLYLDRCRRQLEVEKAKAPAPVVNERRNQFAIWSIYDEYCPFNDTLLGGMWKGMKKVILENETNQVLWDNVTWSDMETIEFVTMFNGITLKCSLKIEKNNLLLSTRLKKTFQCQPISVHQLEMLIRSVVWPALLLTE